MSEPARSPTASCPECRRRVGLRPKGDGWVFRAHSMPGAGRCSATGRAAVPEDDGRAMLEAAAAMDPGERPTWERALEVYERTAVSKSGRRLNERTLRKYRPHLREFSAWCKASGVDTPPDLTFDTLRTFHGLTIGEQVSARDAQVIAAVRSFTRWAGEHWPASLPSPSRVARACPLVKVQSSPHPVLSKADTQAVDRYLAHVTEAGEIAALKDASCLVLAAYSGLRRAEIVGLDLGDIDDHAEGYWILNVVGKGGKRRGVPLHASAARVVQRYIEVTDRAIGGDGPVIVPRGGATVRRVRGEMVYAAVKRAQLAARVSRPVTPHGLRSTFALRFLQGSHGDLQALQKLLGHSAPETTMVYASHVVMERVSPHIPAVG